jgi:hypothetical protein
VIYFYYYVLAFIALQALNNFLKQITSKTEGVLIKLSEIFKLVPYTIGAYLLFVITLQ